MLDRLFDAQSFARRMPHFECGAFDHSATSPAVAPWVGTILFEGVAPGGDDRRPAMVRLQINRGIGRRLASAPVSYQSRGRFRL